jgi:DNA-directed RNA polymerase subunit E"
MAKRPKGRVPPFKACRRCGTLFSRKESVCPACGSSDVEGENWSGMIIVLDPENSIIARELKIEKPVVKAIIVARRVMI